MTDPAQDNGQTIDEDPGTAAGAGVRPLAQPAQATGQTELVVGAAFIGGLILGRLVKRRDKQL